MVCDRCNLAVSSLLDEMEFGQVNFGDRVLTESVLNDLKIKLERLGFELFNDKIKTSIIDLVQGQYSLENIKLSDWIKHN